MRGKKLQEASFVILIPKIHDSQRGDRDMEVVGSLTPSEGELWNLRIHVFGIGHGQYALGICEKALLDRSARQTDVIHRPFMGDGKGRYESVLLVPAGKRLTVHTVTGWVQKLSQAVGAQTKQVAFTY